jgi:hypothetical protein
MPKAIRITATGGPEVLRWEDVEVGEPGEGQARVRHTAVGVNFIDTYHRSGLYPLPLPSGLGSEAAGVVEAVGPGVTVVRPGDRVTYAGGPPGLGTEIDPPFLVVMLGLVLHRYVFPDPAGRVEVAGPYDADFTRPHAGQSLKFDHRPDLAGDVGPDRVHGRIGDRLDRLRLTDVGPATAKPWNGLEAMVEGRRDHLLDYCPFEADNWR